MPKRLRARNGGIGIEHKRGQLRETGWVLLREHEKRIALHGRN